MIALGRIALQLFADLAGLVVLLLAPRRFVAAENLFLRRELALYQERGIKPRRVDAATRVSLALLSRLFDWRDALVLVWPETLIRWHRAGWRLFWRLKSRLGRPPITLELRQLIRRMTTENPIWDEDRIANELRRKLGLRVSPRTVRKLMPNTSNLKWFAGTGEYAIDWGPGYRIYLAKDGGSLIVWFGGGTKRRQQADIERSKAALHAEYKSRKAPPPAGVKVRNRKR